MCFENLRANSRFAQNLVGELLRQAETELPQRLTAPEDGDYPRLSRTKKIAVYREAPADWQKFDHIQV